MNRVAIMISSLSMLLVFFGFYVKYWLQPFLRIYIWPKTENECVLCVYIAYRWWGCITLMRMNLTRLESQSDFISIFFNSFSNFQAFTFWNLWKPVAQRGNAKRRTNWMNNIYLKSSTFSTVSTKFATAQKFYERLNKKRSHRIWAHKSHTHAHRKMYVRACNVIRGLFRKEKKKTYSYYGHYRP